MNADVNTIDLHCHILPGIDDGSKNPEMSIEMLKIHQAAGVDAVCFTPHFHYERTTFEKFVERRARAYDRLIDAAAKERDLTIYTKLGAEVRYSSALPKLDLSQLAIEGTPYILIELSTQTQPSGAEDVFYEIMQQGYIPVLAHVERYKYVEDNPQLLYNWVSDGCLAQVNAEPMITGGPQKKLIERYIDRNLVHIMCSDSHNLTSRKPNLAEGLAELDEETREYFLYNAEDIYLGRTFEAMEPEEPKLRMGKWR